MQSKTILFIADSLDNAHRFQKVLSTMDVEVLAGSSAQFSRLVVEHSDYDLIIYEVTGKSDAALAAIERAVTDAGSAAVLLIVDEADVDTLRLPVAMRSDFVVRGAGDAECALRVRNLLWPGSESGAADSLIIDSMTINLATYQVKVGGEPIDLTYLEYALLSFLATHPGRTYTRDALLSRVWGFDYYGGSRTVDVHVRRIRAKLGPELAWRLETVRGVGYLWSS